MAKQVKNKIKENGSSVKTEGNNITSKSNEVKIINDKTYSDDSTLSNNEEYVVNEPIKNINSLKDVNIVDLISYEKACALLCKRYEMSVRVDEENNNKFKEYKNYYEKIFSEIEARVFELCK